MNLDNPIVGIFITLLSYMIALEIHKNLKSPWTNPLLIGILINLMIIFISPVSYDDYKVGAASIQFFIAPATICLVLPFYKNLDIFLKYKKAIFLGSLSGALTSMASIVILGRMFGLSKELMTSLLPKSVTAAISLPLGLSYGGLGSLISFTILIVGLFGTMISEKAFEVLRIKNDIVKGVALGTTSHAVGTSKALEISEVAAAISGLCIVLTGIITVLFFPLFFAFI